MVLRVAVGSVGWAILRPKNMSPSQNVTGSYWTCENLGVALFADFCLLAAECAQVVELGATNVTSADELDVVDDRRVDRKLTLDADLERDFANVERLANSVTVTADNHTLENLDSAAITFNNVYVNLHRVADAEVGDVATKRRGVNCIKFLHCSFAFCTRFGTDAGGSGRDVVTWLFPRSRGPVNRVCQSAQSTILPQSSSLYQLG